MMESSGKNLWIGMTDRETEGTFKYLNGETVNAHVSQGETLLYYFKGGQPNNSGGNEHCAQFVPPGVNLPLSNVLNDAPCSATTWGNSGVDFHGMCEIKILNF